MSHWSYVQKGSISDEIVGEVTSEELLRLAYEGKIRPKTSVLHSEHTRNQWVLAERIPAVLKKYNEGEEVRRQERAERLRQQQEWVQRRTNQVSTSLKAGATQLHSVMGRLFPKREPELRRCVSGIHHDFSASTKCSVCKQPSIGIADSEWGDVISDFIYPFLQRNERPTSDEIPTDAFVIRHLKSLDHAATAVVADNELAMLKQVLGDAFPAKNRAEAQSFLNSCALRSDFMKFRGRIEAGEDAGLDTFEAYASVASHDPTFLPFFQQLFKERTQQVDASFLVEQVNRVRAQNQLKGFAADLSHRRVDSISVTIDIIDSMNPFDFELLLGMIYQALGYKVTETPKGSDQGADVFVEKAGIKTVIQAKLYSDAVGNKAVQEAIAARSHFKCHEAKVVTNQQFTKSAKELAETSNVDLIDREALIEMVQDFNRRPKDYSRLASLFASRNGATHSSYPVASPVKPPPRSSAPN